MTVPKDTALEAINDARALLDALVVSEWREMHVVSGDSEIFLARKGGGENPMRRSSAPLNAAAPPVPVPAASRAEMAVKVPHVATLVSALTVGTQVSAGQTVATLRVLGDESLLAATVSGTVVALDAKPGDLLDYDTPVVRIAEDA